MIKFAVLYFLVLLSVHAFSQYDNWKNYTNANSIRFIIPDNEYVWLGGDGTGLIRYLSLTRFNQNDEWTDYNLDNSPLITRGLYDLYSKDNVMWIATDSGLYTVERFFLTVKTGKFLM
jgi:ligand-binding sensor domain-containing protein